MYTDFYRLTALPFQLTPDHRFFFDSRQHRKAMAYLSYGLSKGEGFVIVTGEIGAGKTTLIDQLLATVADRELVVAKINTTQLEAEDLLRLVASGLGISVNQISKAELLGRLEKFFLQTYHSGKRVIIIVDESQSLRPSALEELRMLSNFGTNSQPVVQIVLVGQPEFRRYLMSDSFEQLRQRMIASFHLRALDAEDTQRYIEHRLARVEWHGDPSFTPDAYGKIFQRSGGIPRQINLLCDRMLLFGYLEEKHELTASDVDEVLIDLDEEMAVGTFRDPRSGLPHGGSTDEIAHSSYGPNGQKGPSSTWSDNGGSPGQNSPAAGLDSRAETNRESRSRNSDRPDRSSNGRDASQPPAIADILRRLEALEKGKRR